MILNKTHKCACGRWKNARCQWCSDCFARLSEAEKLIFDRQVSKLRQVLAVLEKKIMTRVAAAPAIRTDAGGKK
jgi:hypothetical protein